MSAKKEIRRAARTRGLARIMKLQNATMRKLNPFVKPSRKGRGMTRPLSGPSRTRG